MVLGNEKSWASVAADCSVHINRKMKTQRCEKTVRNVESSNVKGTKSEGTCKFVVLGFYVG